MTLSRRQALKVISGTGLALYFSPMLFDPRRALAATGESDADFLRRFSPIDRTLEDKAFPDYFGDNPTRAHQILWNKQGFVAGAKAPVSTEKASVVVIGGGISGLTTAYLLRQHKPIVLEQARRFGGNAQGHSWRGVEYAIGAAYACEPGEDTDILKLFTELGLTEKWKLKEGEDPVALKGKIFKEFWTGETEPDPKARGQFETLSGYFKKVLDGTELSYPDIPIVDEEKREYVEGLDAKSFRVHLEELAGGALHPHIETAIEHYCWSSFGASSTEVSAACGVNFYAAEFGNLVVFPGGNGAIAEALFQKLTKEISPANLRCEALVYDVAVTDGGVTVSYQDGEGKVRRIEAKAVVMACPKFVAAKLIDGLEQERIDAIRKLRYHSYLVANVCLTNAHRDPFYDLYLLGEGSTKSAQFQEHTRKQKITDVILATFAHADQKSTVLTLYRGLPYDGARAELFAQDSYKKYREEFEKQIVDEVLPLLKRKKQEIVDLRVARWGHPLPVAAPGLIRDGVVATMRKPFKERVFFVEQDSWALPAIETALTEAFTWAPEIEKLFAEPVAG